MLDILEKIYSNCYNNNDHKNYRDEENRKKNIYIYKRTQSTRNNKNVDNEKNNYWSNYNYDEK